MFTPRMLGIEKKTIIIPNIGWKEQTYYIIEVAYTPDNIVHKAIFYSGYIQNGNPAGYNAIGSFVKGEDCTNINNVFFMKVIYEIGKLEDF